jgi:hypothetical protein
LRPISIPANVDVISGCPLIGCEDVLLLADGNNQHHHVREEILRTSFTPPMFDASATFQIRQTALKFLAKGVSL